MPAQNLLPSCVAPSPRSAAGRRYPTALVILLGAAALAACHDTGAEPLPECSDRPVPHVTADTGLTPLLSWTPACRAAKVQVQDTLADLRWPPVWAFEVDQNSVVPPLRYGATPAGAQNVVGPAPLQHGHGYVVTIWRRTKDPLSPFAAGGVGRRAP